MCVRAACIRGRGTGGGSAAFRPSTLRQLKRGDKPTSLQHLFDSGEQIGSDAGFENVAQSANGPCSLNIIKIFVDCQENHLGSAAGVSKMRGHLNTVTKRHLYIEYKKIGIVGRGSFNRFFSVLCIGEDLKIVPK